MGLRTCISTKCLCPRPNFEKLLCDIMILDKKHTFSLCPIFGTELLKPLTFPVMKAIKVSLDVLMRWLVDPTKGWRLVANGANHETETWNFQLHPGLGKEKLEIEFSDQ